MFINFHLIFLHPRCAAFGQGNLGIYHIWVQKKKHSSILHIK